MVTTKHELIERVRLIVQEMQADNAETIISNQMVKQDITLSVYAESKHAKWKAKSTL